MKIGVLGTGDVGRALASGFVTAGHDVMIGSRSASNEAAGLSAFLSLLVVRHIDFSIFG